MPRYQYLDIDIFEIERSLRYISRKTRNVLGATFCVRKGVRIHVCICLYSPKDTLEGYTRDLKVVTCSERGRNAQFKPFYVF